MDKISITITITINENDISWSFNNHLIVFDGDFVKAEHYPYLNAIVALEYSLQEFFLISMNGNLISHKKIITSSDQCEVYSLLGAQTQSTTSIRVVMGHTPDYKGETFWQHDIDLDTGVLSEPICRWR